MARLLRRTYCAQRTMHPGGIDIQPLRDLRCLAKDKSRLSSWINRPVQPTSFRWRTGRLRWRGAGSCRTPSVGSSLRKRYRGAARRSGKVDVPEFRDSSGPTTCTRWSAPMLGAPKQAPAGPGLGSGQSGGPGVFTNPAVGKATLQ